MKQNNVLTEKERYQDMLRKAGLRLSRGRLGVFKEAMLSHGHFTAEAIVKECLKHHPAISRATVYRSLHEMMEFGLIRGTAFGEKHQIFEHVYDEKPHHHARCIHCHELLEFPDLGEDKRYHAILSKEKFKILGHEMHFYGICAACQ